ncbi:flagellar M-ring protein FliF [Granulicella sp. 5B5]|uniref:flagellar basal-body MS-ring/collar protein FliF n=1 Tax=Granulicella sp. 5B5 TaxID=1617967 RepID=UPI0015F3D0BE|nr:flagellar basal-body MS-ring/collar protein FliF [Granulicella sp. 5B5]QMV17526.1 flagellar M-ring protein FliF [Granulicella sp. 5B5]
MSNLTTKPAAANNLEMLNRVKVFWAGRTPRQRIYLGVALGIALAALALFAQMMTNPDYKLLMSGLDPADAQVIASELAQKKIPYKTSTDGSSISVPAAQLDAARLEVASHDATHSGRIGFEIFDKVSWGQTEFDEKVNYQRALEGELERTIQTMKGVKSARVHIVMATDSVFMDRERGAKASVALQLRRGTLSREQDNAIARLVAGAVDELKPADVTIVDADSNRPLTTRDDDSGTGNEQLEKRLTQHLVETLAPVVGQDHLRATVNVEYDNSTSEESQEKYDPNVSVPLNVQRSEQSSNGAAAIGGVPGTTSNVPGAKASVPPAVAPGQSSKSEEDSYGVNRTTRHTVEPAGRIRRITAAVVVDDAVERKLVKGSWVETRHKRSPDEIKLISELTQAAVGYDSGRGDVVNVENLAFAEGAQDLNPSGSFMERTHEFVEDYAPLFRYGSLFALFGLIYFLMFRPIQKQALSITEPIMNELAAPLELPALEGESSQEMLAHRAALLKKQLTEAVRANPESGTSAIRSWLQEDNV